MKEINKLLPNKIYKINSDELKKEINLDKIKNNTNYFKYSGCGSIITDTNLYDKASEELNLCIDNDEKNKKSKKKDKKSGCVIN